MTFHTTEKAAAWSEPQETTCPSDTLTVLTCHDAGATAAKVFIVLDDGTVQKCGYDAKTYFQYEEIPVSCLNSLCHALVGLEAEPKKLIIRGKPKKDAGNIVRRKVRGEDAAFEPASRRWVMLDVDKREIPDSLDLTANPEEVIKWLLNQLPEPFRKADCLFQFSSSQNIPEKVGDAPRKVVSVHFWFWCDRPVSDEEWKRFFKIDSLSTVDLSLFNAVQAHYVARPSFRGMDDPMPRRMGLLRGDSDTVFVPPIRESGADESFSHFKTTDWFHFQRGQEYSADEVQDMLSYLDPDMEYLQWVKIGMALHDAGYSCDLWDEWSRGSQGKYKEGECWRKWDGFTPNNGVSMGTLVHWAKAAGWMRVTPTENAPAAETGQPKPQPDAARDQQNINMANLAIIGVIGDTVKEILSTATQPQPELAILNTITALGAVFGRAYQSPMGTRTNLYTVGIAGTGAGKDHSRKFIKRLMMKAGLEVYIGGDGIISGAGILTSVNQQPSQIMHLDEFGMLLGAMTDKKGAPYMKACSKVITELYSASSSTYLGGQYADQRSKPFKIEAPNLCIFGTTTLGNYTDAMKKSVIASGELNRYIIIKPDVDFPQRKRATGNPVPSDALIAKWKSIDPTLLPNGFYRAVDTSNPTVVAWGDGVGERVWNMGLHQDAKVASNPVTGALWARYAENSIKIAMIIAICRDQINPVIIDQDFDIAELIIKKSVFFMEELATRHMADSEHEKDCNRLVNEIAAAGRSISKTTLCDRTKDMNKKRRDDALESLLERDVIAIEGKDSKSGKGRKAYWISLK